jgi:hypothetical protein
MSIPGSGKWTWQEVRSWGNYPKVNPLDTARLTVKLLLDSHTFIFNGLVYLLLVLFEKARAAEAAALPA